MSKAEKEAYKARVKDLVAQGIEKEIAAVMAEVEIKYEIIKPVVY